MTWEHSLLVEGMKLIDSLTPGPPKRSAHAPHAHSLLPPKSCSCSFCAPPSLNQNCHCRVGHSGKDFQRQGFLKMGVAGAFRCGPGHSESWGREPGSCSPSPDLVELSQGLGQRSTPCPSIQAPAPSSSLISVHSPSSWEPLAAELGHRAQSPGHLLHSWVDPRLLASPGSIR